MPVLNSVGMALLQREGGHDVHMANIWLFIIMLALCAQAAGVVAVGIYAARFLAQMKRLSDNFEAKATPILVKADALLDELGPKVRNISTNVEQISFTVREKADEMGATLTQVNRTVEEINMRTRMQVARADAIVSDALEATEDISATVQHGIRVPLRQVVGIVAGVKAGIETLVSRFPFGR